MDAASDGKDLLVADVAPPGSLGMFARFGIARTSSNESPEQQEMRLDREAVVLGLARGRLEWYGTTWRDWFFYLKQHHIILAMFFCHRRHPFNRAMRVLAFLSYVAAGFGLALLLSKPDGTKDEGFFANVVSAIVGVLMPIFWQSLNALYTCSCLQEGSCLYGLGMRTGSGFNRVVALFSWSFAGCCLLLGGVTAWATHEDLDVAARVFLQSQLISWCFMALFQTLLFLIGYGSCCCRGEAGQEGKKSASKYPHAGYPKDKSLFVQQDPCNCMSPGFALRYSY